MQKAHVLTENVLIIVKILLIIYILLSPFINHKFLTIANTFSFKLTFIILITIVSFIDLQLAILMTLGFLIMVINLNIPKQIKQSAPSLEPFSVNLPVSENLSTQTISEFPDKCDVKNFNDEDMNTDMYNIYIDSKIKPYENYIKQLSSPELIEKASGFNFF